MARPSTTRRIAKTLCLWASVVMLAVALKYVTRGESVDIVWLVATGLMIVLTVFLCWSDRPYPSSCCQFCGYNLTGNVSGICSECGTRIPEPARDDQCGNDVPADACPMCRHSLVHEPEKPASFLGREGETFCIFCKRWVPPSKPPTDSC